MHARRKVGVRWTAFIALALLACACENQQAVGKQRTPSLEKEVTNSLTRFVAQSRGNAMVEVTDAASDVIVRSKLDSRKVVSIFRKAWAANNIAKWAGVARITLSAPDGETISIDLYKVNDTLDLLRPGSDSLCGYYMINGVGFLYDGEDELFDALFADWR